MTARGEPAHDCGLCDRLLRFRCENQTSEPHWFNAPVPTFGDLSARLLIVGLAPGLRGANRTGRPFTGDYAGELLYATLLEIGFAEGTYDRRRDDGLVLIDCAVTNAVRCVPPQNKPLPEEIRTCRQFLRARIGAMLNLRAIIVLGRIAHESVLRGFDVKLSAAPFAHARRHELGAMETGPIALFDSYHCSRYNTNTGLLTQPMFRDVFVAARAHLDDTAPPFSRSA